ncbi:MAG TPA: response regulator [Thermoanaerobaculia bacterium]|nr:response regulator [Thermoanaerobaculia bacterium]
MSAKFLIVDDDDGIRRLVSAVLRRQKYETDEARDGQEAIDKLSENNSYDALFLDLMMPIRSGYEVIAFLREQQPVRKCVVVMTAAGTRGPKDLDLSVIHRVLHKPFDIEDVLEAAAECVAGQR